MTAKDVRFSFRARARLLRGIDTLAETVRVTLGPKGRNVAIEREHGPPRVTKDGVTVAKEIELLDKFENMGAQMAKEVASKTSYQAGDGTTTAVVLAHAIVREGAKAVAAGMNPMDVKRGIDLAVEHIVAELKKRARPVGSNGEIAQIGTISANGDAEIGQTLADAMKKVGKDGVITVEEAKSIDTEIDVIHGIQFDRGYISPHFITNRATLKSEMADALILLSENKLDSLNRILPLLESVVKTEKPLLIIAEEVEGEVMAALVVNKLRGALKVAAVKAPAYGELRKAMLHDMAAMTGGTVISEDLGIKIENVTPDMLGKARKVIIGKDETTIIGGAGKESAIAERCAQIKKQIAEATSDYDLEKLRERLGKLSGGIAVIKVGGATEIEVREKKDRIDDAMNATRAAVEEGILPGGGVALLRAGHAIINLKSSNADQNAGIEIVRRAVKWPARQIIDNSGEDGAVVIRRILEKDDMAYGYDAQSGEYGDLIKRGIIDPAKVVRTALQGAASIAGLLVTTEAMVAERRTGLEDETLHGHDHEHIGNADDYY